MCFGGGGSGATITMPDTSAYDRMANMQVELMRQQQQGAMGVKQAELNQALQGQQQALADLRDFSMKRANETQANAARMAALIGPPPPEKSAMAPTVGSDRSAASKAQGKRGLRIERRASTSQGSGTGLNITTA